MEEKYLIQTREAELFGVNQTAINGRTKRMSNYPKQVPHPMFGTLCRKLSELQAYSRAFHDFVPGKCLFTDARLAELSPEEIEAFGVQQQYRQRVAK